MAMKNSEDQIKKWLLDAGRESASPGFSERVLASVSREAAADLRTSSDPHPAYRPVISPLGVRLIALGVAAVFAGIILFVPEAGGAASQTGESLAAKWLDSPVFHAGTNLAENFSLPAIIAEPGWLSPLFGYAFLALALTSLLSAFFQRFFLRL